MSSKDMKILISGATDVGKKRDHNEDVFLIDENMGLALVADGMGGHDAGEVASKMAAETIYDFICKPALDEIELNNIIYEAEDDDNVKKAISIAYQAVVYANKKICEENRNRGYRDGNGMGTTVAGVWVLKNLCKAIIFHVGDSRVYFARQDEFKQLTKDHSLYQEWINRGSIGPAPRSNIICKALGPYGDVEPDILVLDLKTEDSFLICSDGLTDMVKEEYIEKTMKEINPKQVKENLKKLIDEANLAGGKDNITVCFIRAKFI